MASIPGLWTKSPVPILPFRRLESMTCARLLLYTRRRRSDVVLFGPQHLRANGFILRSKNAAKKPFPLTLPIDPGVNSSLKRHSGRIGLSGDGERGRPFAANAFRNRFRKSCDRASLPPECSAHGFRKAPATLCRGRIRTRNPRDHGSSGIAGSSRYTKAAEFGRAAENVALRHRSRLYDEKSRRGPAHKGQPLHLRPSREAI
jgi:hypothetical protein